MVAVTQSLETIFSISINNHSRLFLAAALTGVSLSELEIWVVAKANKTPVRLYSESSEYLNPDGLLVGTSGDLTKIADGDDPWFIIDVQCVEVLFLKAAIGISGETDVTVSYNTIA